MTSAHPAVNSGSVWPYVKLTIGVARNPAASHPAAAPKTVKG
jgi:hypothetical protein